MTPVMFGQISTIHFVATLANKIINGYPGMTHKSVSERTSQAKCVGVVFF